MKYETKVFNDFPAIKMQFFAGVELGVPSKKCKNFGICRITPIGMLEEAIFESNCKCQCKGILTLLEDDTIELYFLKRSINPADLKKHFSSGKFWVEEDFFFNFPKDDIYSFRIKSGVYPVTVSNSLVQVKFDNVVI